MLPTLILSAIVAQTEQEASIEAKEAFRSRLTGQHSLLVWAGATTLSRTLFRNVRADVDQVQDVVDGVKEGRSTAMLMATRWIAVNPDLHRRGLLIPIPRSSPENPSLLPFASMLVSYGVGHGAREVLVRREAVPSSRLEWRAGRPRVDLSTHVASFAVARPRPGEESLPLVLLDDVLVHGVTMRAAVQVLREAGWRGSIRGVVVAKFADSPRDLYHRASVGPVLTHVPLREDKST